MRYLQWLVRSSLTAVMLWCSLAGTSLGMGIYVVLSSNAGGAVDSPVSRFNEMRANKP
jgi:Na+/phosphate symporter